MGKTNRREPRRKLKNEQALHRMGEPSVEGDYPFHYCPEHFPQGSAQAYDHDDRCCDQMVVVEKPRTCGPHPTSVEGCGCKTSRPCTMAEWVERYERE